MIGPSDPPLSWELMWYLEVRQSYERAYARGDRDAAFLLMRYLAEAADRLSDRDMEILERT